MDTSFSGGYFGVWRKVQMHSAQGVLVQAYFGDFLV